MNREQCIQALDTLCDAVSFCDNCPIGKAGHAPFCRSTAFKYMSADDLKFYAEIVGFKYDGSDPEPRPDYWANVCEIQRRQTEKGVKKYGKRLEDNHDLKMTERLEYLEEELIDGLMYIEHIKACFHDAGVFMPVEDLREARDRLDKMIRAAEEDLV